MSLEFGARFSTRSFCITGCAGAAVAAVTVALLRGDMAWRLAVGRDTDVVQAITGGAKQAPKSANRPTRNDRAGRMVASAGSKTASACLFFNFPVTQRFADRRRRPFEKPKQKSGSVWGLEVRDPSGTNTRGGAYSPAHDEMCHTVPARPIDRPTSRVCLLSDLIFSSHLV